MAFIKLNYFMSNSRLQRAGSLSSQPLVALRLSAVILIGALAGCAQNPYSASGTAAQPSAADLFRPGPERGPKFDSPDSLFKD